MSEQVNRNTLERYFQAFERHDLDTIDALLHDDYVEEYPQSGESIRGKHNARMDAENYPGSLPNMIDYSYIVSGDLGVGELLLEYHGDRVYVCDILELEDSKIKKTRAYFSRPFETPEWRAQWTERIER